MNDKIKERKIEWLAKWLLTNTDPIPAKSGITAHSMATQIVMALDDIELDEMMKWHEVHKNDPTPFDK